MLSELRLSHKHRHRVSELISHWMKHPGKRKWTFNKNDYWSSWSRLSCMFSSRETETWTLWPPHSPSFILISSSSSPVCQVLVVSPGSHRLMFLYLSESFPGCLTVVMNIWCILMSDCFCCLSQEESGGWKRLPVEPRSQIRLWSGVALWRSSWVRWAAPDWNAVTAAANYNWLWINFLIKYKIWVFYIQSSCVSLTYSDQRGKSISSKISKNMFCPFLLSPWCTVCVSVWSSGDSVFSKLI